LRIVAVLILTGTMIPTTFSNGKVDCDAMAFERHATTKNRVPQWRRNPQANPARWHRAQRDRFVA